MSLKECGCTFGGACKLECLRSLNKRKLRKAMKPGKWPIHSEGLRVHSSQVAEAKEHAKRRGVNIDFDSENRPVISDAQQFKDYAKTRGLRHLGY